MYKALSAIVWGVKDVTPSGALGLLGVGKALRRKIVSFGKDTFQHKFEPVLKSCSRANVPTGKQYGTEIS